MNYKTFYAVAAIEVLMCISIFTGACRSCSCSDNKDAKSRTEKAAGPIKKEQLPTKIVKETKEITPPPAQDQSQNAEAIKRLSEIKPLIQSGDTKKATEALEKLTKDFPGYGFGWYLLGQHYKKSGRDQDAQNCFDKAHKLGTTWQE